MGGDIVGSHDFLEKREGGEGGVEAVEVEFAETIAEGLGKGPEGESEGKENGDESGENAEDEVPHGR